MARKVARKTVGICSISIGVLFGVLPFVPGILLIIAGLELLGYRKQVWAWIQSKFKRRGNTIVTPLQPEPDI